MLNNLAATLYHVRMEALTVQIRLVVLLVLSFSAVVLYVPLAVNATPSPTELTVRFLDVGQGDAIHIVTPDGYELLIDGGATASVLRELSSDRSFFDRYIDVMIATHPDTDHIGGLVDVLERYEVATIINTSAENDTPATTAYELAVSNEGANMIEAAVGQVLQLGASTTIRVLSPRGDTSNWQSNAASIIVQVVYGDMAFMLTGDAPASIEDYLVGAYGTSLKSNVLKLGHHGSKTSTSELFLATVQPEYAVVSASVDNRYGHPHQEVMQRVFDRNIRAFHTGTDGTITFKSDGQTVWVE